MRDAGQKHASIRRVRPVPDLPVFDVFRDEAPTSDTSQNTPRFNALAPSETPPRSSSFDTVVRRETRAKTCPVSTLSTRLKPLCFDLFRDEAPAVVVAQNMPCFDARTPSQNISDFSLLQHQATARDACQNMPRFSAG